MLAKAFKRRASSHHFRKEESVLERRSCAMLGNWQTRQSHNVSLPSISSSGAWRASAASLGHVSGASGASQVLMGMRTVQRRATAYTVSSWAKTSSFRLACSPETGENQPREANKQASTGKDQSQKSVNVVWEKALFGAGGVWQCCGQSARVVHSPTPQLG